MMLDEFSKLSTDLKWAHISNIMVYITAIELKIMHRQQLYKMGALIGNEDTAKQDIADHRTEQASRWAHVKDLYASHRDELANTMGNDTYKQHQNVLERIFTNELDEALHKVLTQDS